MPASTNANARREREPFPPSCPCTPTAIRLHPKGFAPIPNLKRTLEPIHQRTEVGCEFTCHLFVFVDVGVVIVAIELFT